MDSSYTSEHPSGINIPPEALEFFQAFYRTSDTPDAHQQYANMFTEDATFILASKLSTGHGEILATREGMWSAVSSRRHTPVKIFPFGDNAEEFMLYGRVAYRFKTGVQADVDWAARAILSKAQGRLRLKFYQVYLDTAGAAKKE